MPVFNLLGQRALSVKQLSKWMVMEIFNHV